MGNRTKRTKTRAPHIHIHISDFIMYKWINLSVSNLIVKLNLLSEQFENVKSRILCKLQQGFALKTKKKRNKILEKSSTEQHVLVIYRSMCSISILTDTRALEHTHTHRYLLAKVQLDPIRSDSSVFCFHYFSYRFSAF